MPRYRLLVVFAIAGCADILGIGDVPQPVATDGGVDAPFDSLVVGCNGAYRCVASAPAGWTLVAFAATTGSSLPVGGCSGAYGANTAQGHDGLSAGAAQCTCSCTNGQATGTTCGSVVINGYSGNGCNSSVDQQISVPAGTCGSFNSAQGSLAASPGAPTSLGSCGTPNATKNVPTLSWAHSYVACGYTAPDDEGGCTSGNRCVQLPSSAFDNAPCVEQSGDVACPGAPYTSKTLVLTQLSDTRDCAKCNCDPSGGSCAATLTGYQDVSCTVSPFSVAANGVCTAQGASALSVFFNASTVTPASCSASGGGPSGGASASGPVTVCCP